MCVYVNEKIYILDMYMEIKYPEIYLKRKGETFSYLWFYINNLKFVTVKTSLENILDLKNYTPKINML